MRQYREKWVAGTFIQQTGTNAPSSLTGLNVASAAAFRDISISNVTSLADLTISSLTGAAGWRGLGVLSAATAITSIQASAAQSGACVFLTPHGYATVDSFKSLMVSSVGAGFFNVMCAQSTPPSAVMNFSWEIVR